MSESWLVRVCAFVAAGLLSAVMFQASPEAEHRQESGSVASRSVMVSTDPEGALLFADGRFVGKTPEAVAFHDKDRVAVTLKKQDHYEVSRVISLSEGSAVTVKLDRIPEGTLKVISNPSGAAVFLEDTFLGKTPLEVDGIDCGRYLVRLVRANYLPKLEGVQIDDGQVSILEAALESKVEVFYKAAIAAEPDNIPFYTELGHYYLISERKDEAVDTYGRALAISGNLSGNYREQMPNVARLLNEIRKLQHGHRDVVMKLMPEIEKMADALVANKAIPAVYLNDVSRRLRMLGRRDLAAKVGGGKEAQRIGFQDIIRLQREVVEAERKGNKKEAYKIHLALADMYGRMTGKAVMTRSIDHLNKAARLTEDVGARVDLGLRIAGIYVKLKNDARVCEVLEKVVALMPAKMAGTAKFWDATRDLSAAYLRQGKKEQARAVFTRIIQKYPDKKIQKQAQKHLNSLQ